MDVKYIILAVVNGQQSLGRYKGVLRIIADKEC